MYIPPKYRQEDLIQILALIKHYPFATLITNGTDAPFATHLPVMLAAEGKQQWLEFHMPRHNPHFKALTNGKTSSKMIFMGPNGYISSGWYNYPEVSTWNYQAVHVQGVPESLSDDLLLKHLNSLTHYFEQQEIPGYRLTDLPKQVVHGQLSAIGGFRIALDNWEASFKLSQKMDDNNRQNIIHKLENRKGTHDMELAEAMKQTP